MTEHDTLPLDDATLVVGSRNPTKLEAVHIASSLHFRRIRVIGVEAGSGVSEQPLSDEETVLGAENRARVALAEHSAAHYGIGIESGVSRLGEHLFGFTWVVVAHAGGGVGRGCSARIQLPPSVAREVETGIPLGEAMRRATGIMELGRGGGAVGLLTRGAVSRTDATVQALHFAFAAVVSPGLYRL